MRSLKPDSEYFASLDVPRNLGSTSALSSILRRGEARRRISRGTLVLGCTNTGLWMPARSISRNMCEIVHTIALIQDACLMVVALFPTETAYI